MAGTSGSGGHNRLSKKTKKLRGTLVKHREKKKSPAPPASKLGVPPKDMSALQKRVWAELLPQVEAVGVTTVSDAASYRLLVEAVAATRDIESVSASQRPRIMGYAATMLARFGLDPLSRERLSAKGGGDDKAQDEEVGTVDDVPLFGQPLKLVDVEKS